MNQISVPLKFLRNNGIEVLNRGATSISLPRHTVLEAPGSLKWTQYEHSLEMGTFSYQVSGYCFAARIGRYCSFGESVQIGRQNHPLDWVSTSPAFYLGDRVFELGDGFEAAEHYHHYRTAHSKPPTKVKITTIGNDVVDHRIAERIRQVHNSDQFRSKVCYRRRNSRVTHRDHLLGDIENNRFLE